MRETINLKMTLCRVVHPHHLLERGEPVALNSSLVAMLRTTSLPPSLPETPPSSSIPQETKVSDSNSGSILTETTVSSSNSSSILNETTVSSSNSSSVLSEDTLSTGSSSSLSKET